MPLGGDLPLEWRNFLGGARMAKIFLSYRQDDSQAEAGRLSDLLKHKFGRDNVFIDVENIELGTNFVQRLAAEVEHLRCVSRNNRPPMAHPARRPYRLCTRRNRSSVTAQHSSYSNSNQRRRDAQSRSIAIGPERIRRETGLRNPLSQIPVRCSKLVS